MNADEIKKFVESFDVDGRGVLYEFTEKDKDELFEMIDKIEAEKERLRRKMEKVI